MKSRFNLSKTLFPILASLFLVIFYSGCSDSNVTDPGTDPVSSNVSISIKSNNAQDDPLNEIVINEAKALLTEIEFELEGSGIEHEIKPGPIVVHFNTTGGMTTLTTGNVPAGVYNKVKFQLHKPEDYETIPDPEFREGTSGNLRYSFIIKGSYNGNSFVYKSKKSINLVINFSSPINFQTSSRNITVLINTAGWFKNGNIVLDPRDTDNEDMIDNNLENSFEGAFKDDDKNGSPDDN
jgi:hypothetical protein